MAHHARLVAAHEGLEEIFLAGKNPPDEVVIGKLFPRRRPVLQRLEKAARRPGVRPEAGGGGLGAGRIR
jgi:hypothetical protein